MAWYGKTDKTFTVIANELIRQAADDATKTDVLAALMDHIGVPVMVAEKYRADAAIRALFASRGVTLLDRADAPPTQVARRERPAGTP